MTIRFNTFNISQDTNGEQVSSASIRHIITTGRYPDFTDGHLICHFPNAVKWSLHDSLLKSIVVLLVNKSY